MIGWVNSCLAAYVIITNIPQDSHLNLYVSLYALHFTSLYIYVCFSVKFAAALVVLVASHP